MNAKSVPDDVDQVQAALRLHAKALEEARRATDAQLASERLVAQLEQHAADLQAQVVSLEDKEAERVQTDAALFKQLQQSLEQTQSAKAELQAEVDRQQLNLHDQHNVSCVLDKR